MSLDIFTGNAFTVINLTARANNPDIVPHVPTKLGDLGLFTPEPITTTSVAIERRDGTIGLLSSKPRGGEPNINTRDSRNIRNLNVPHIPVEDKISADEIQNVRAFGQEQLETLMSVVDNRIIRMDRNIAATQEYLRIGAIHGVITDGDATTTLINLFTEFGITQAAEVDFELDDAATDVRAKCMTVVRGIRDALGAAMFSGIRAECSSEFFDALVTHANVEETFKYQEGSRLRDGMVGQGLLFGGILFEEYRGSVGSTDFIAANKARFYPIGVPGLFVEYYAPANFMETVNSPGLARYAKVAPDARFQQFVEVHLQSNPLPICTRPEVLWSATLA